MDDIMFSKYKQYQVIMFLCLSITFAGCSENSNKQSINKPEVKPKNISLKNQDLKSNNNIDSSKIIDKVLLDVPIISQHPELKNGCEITSLAMLLKYVGIDSDKMKLAEEIKKDDTPLTHDEDGHIKEWGNPNDGFVGDITGEEDGYAVYDKPIVDLLNKYMPQRAINLTNQSFDKLIKTIDNDRPVIVWITISYEYPKDYKKWKKGDQTIKATFDEHAVLLVGYDKKYCYVNDRTTGKKNQKIKKVHLKKYGVKWEKWQCHMHRTKRNSRHY